MRVLSFVPSLLLATACDSAAPDVQHTPAPAAPRIVLDADVRTDLQTALSDALAFQFKGEGCQDKANTMTVEKLAQQPFHCERTTKSEKGAEVRVELTISEGNKKIVGVDYADHQHFGGVIHYRVGEEIEEKITMDSGREQDSTFPRNNDPPERTGLIGHMDDFTTQVWVDIPTQAVQEARVFYSAHGQTLIEQARKDLSRATKECKDSPSLQTEEGCTIYIESKRETHPATIQLDGYPDKKSEDYSVDNSFRISYPIEGQACEVELKFSDYPGWGTSSETVKCLGEVVYARSVDVQKGLRETQDYDNPPARFNERLLFEEGKAVLGL